uniref:(northern house mosquito) hypothetical protein n=1 Tax=Culex pipiens TaxID=7175 RepID=A0A8D8FSK5_CULPI
MSAKADANAATASGGLRGWFGGLSFLVRNRSPRPTSGFRAPPEPVPGASALLLPLLLPFSTLSTLSSDIFDCSRPTNHRHSHLCGNTTTTTHAHTFSDGPVCQNLDLVDDHLF